MTTKALAPSTVRPASPGTGFATRFGRLLLSANALLVFSFLYLPVIILMMFSFNNTRSVAVFTGFSTEWYIKLIGNEDLLAAARNSLVVGLVSTAASTTIGTLTALAMDRYRFRLRTALDANLYLPIVVPEIVMGISLLLFFNQALFPLIEFVLGFRPATGLHTIALAHIAFNIPFVYIIVRARLADFDRTVEEAAQDLGADEWHTFYRITLPLLMPGIIGGALMAFTLSLDDYLITVFTKGVGEQTMPLYIYSVVRRGVTPEINALSTALLIGSMGLVGLSLTAQGGGPLFTRAMSFGAAIGLNLYSVIRLTGLILAREFSPLELVWLTSGLLIIWLFRAMPDWGTDLREANFPGRVLAIFSLLAAGAAALITLGLLGVK